MLTNALVEHCSPTLAGIKTGNMFSVNTDSADIISEIKNLNRIMTKKGLCLIPLKKSDTSTLIYLYRPDLLKRDLNLPEAEEILEKKGDWYKIKKEKIEGWTYKDNIKEIKK